MLDSPVSAFSSDFKTRYRGCYGFFHGKNEKHFVYIRDVGTKVVFEDIHGVEYYANWDQGVTFEFLPITRGWYFTRNGPRLLLRVPARQYQRGISKSNTSAYHIGRDGILRLISLHFSDLQDVFIDKPQQYPFEAYQKGEEFFYVLNKFFLLSRTRVFMYENPIGVIERNKIKLDDSLYLQELKDAIRRQSLPLEVSV